MAADGAPRLHLLIGAAHPEGPVDELAQTNQPLGPALGSAEATDCDPPSGCECIDGPLDNDVVLGHHFEGVGGSDAVEGRGEGELPHVGAGKLDALPAVALYALAGSFEHPRREVHADDAAGRADGLHQIRQVGTRPAPEVYGRVARPEPERLDGTAVEAACA